MGSLEPGADMVMAGAEIGTMREVVSSFGLSVANVVAVGGRSVLVAICTANMMAVVSFKGPSYKEAQLRSPSRERWLLRRRNSKNSGDRLASN